MASPAKAVRDFVARFVSDTDQFDTDQVERSLNDVEKAAKETGNVVDREMAGMGDAAKEFANDVSTAATELRTKMRQAAKDAGDDVNTQFRDTGKETGKETGAELAANIGEGIKSGDWQTTAADSMQGLASGFAAIPVVGIGLAVAAGIGGAIVSKIGEEAKKAGETAGAVFKAAFEGFMAEKGIEFPETAIGDAAKALIEELSPEDLEGDWAEFTRIAETAGLNVEAVAAALVTGGAPAQELVAQATALRDTQQETYDKIEARIRAEEGEAGIQTDASVRLREQRDTLGEQIGAIDRITGSFGTVATKSHEADVATDNMAGSMRLAEQYSSGTATNLSNARVWAAGMATDSQTAANNYREVASLRYTQVPGAGGKFVRD